MSPVTEPLTKITNPPAKKTTKSKQDKAYEKACKAAEAANKKFNRASDCLKVFKIVCFYIYLKK